MFWNDFAKKNCCFFNLVGERNNRNARAWPFPTIFSQKRKKKEKKSSSHIHLPNWEENKHDIISISTSTSSFRSSQGTFTIFNNIAMLWWLIHSLLKSKLRDWLGLLKNLKNTIIEECQDHCIFLWGSNL